MSRERILVIVTAAALALGVLFAALFAAHAAAPTPTATPAPLVTLDMGATPTGSPSPGRPRIGGCTDHQRANEGITVENTYSSTVDSGHSRTQAVADRDQTLLPGTEYSRDVTVGLAAQLRYLVGKAGTPTKWGVLVTVNEEESYAEVTAEIPRGLPQSSRAQLEVFRYRRIVYTELDRVWDDVHDNPACDWQEASCFVEAVGDAVGAAQAAFEHAARAHAMSQEWTLPFSVPERDQSKYGWYGPDLRIGILESIYGDNYEEVMRSLAEGN